MDTAFSFPFGEPVRLVMQQDRGPKRVFVLGVYASAVHARWVDLQGRTRINALAVASEPYIFWRGDGAEDILKRIVFPDGAGRLLPAVPKLNGPSGQALDNLFLQPLRLQRSDAWLCDLVPHSCLNPRQAAALAREYDPIAEQYGLPPATLPPVPQQLADDARREQIVAELEQSGATTVLLLGDEPVRWFLRPFDSRWRVLADLGQNTVDYGRLHEARIGGQVYRVLPLAHPRQAAKLGTHSQKWHDLHGHWIDHAAHTLEM